MRKIYLLILCTILVSSCVVSKKKYDELNAKKSKLEAEKQTCGDSLKLMNAAKNRLQDLLDKAGTQNNNLSEQISKLTKDTALLSTNLDKLNRDYEDLSMSFEKLLKKHSKLENFSANEAERLTKDLLDREKELIDQKKKVDVLNASLVQRENRVAELEKILAEKDKAVNDLRSKVNQALLNFNGKDLTVNIKNGKVFISLSEQLLFKSGSTEVDPAGVEALKKLAGVLKDQKDISVMVEGHTDDVPLKSGGNMKDNWDLSVLRATSITRILVQNGAEPKNIIPAGRSEYNPLAEGKTPEARKQNRRTEIILTPNLDQLLKVLDQN